MAEKYLVSESIDLHSQPFIYVEEKDAVWVAGKDASSYLQGQLTKDVTKILPGEGAEALLLEPKGDVTCLVSVKKTTENSFLLSVEKGFGPILLERLKKFKIRVKAGLISDVALSFLVFNADHKRDFSELCDAHVSYINNYLASMARNSQFVVAGDSEVKTYITRSAIWRDMGAYEIILPGFTADAISGHGFQLPQSIKEFMAKQVFIERERYDFLRICFGIPKMGVEIKNKVLPPSLGIGDVVIDYNKGCYTGQELVARLDARGNNTPLVLRAVVYDQGEIAPTDTAVPKLYPEASLLFGNISGGTLTSVACMANIEVGIAFITREFAFQPLATVSFISDIKDSPANDLQVSVHQPPLRDIARGVLNN